MIGLVGMARAPTADGVVDDMELRCAQGLDVSGERATGRVVDAKRIGRAEDLA